MTTIFASDMHGTGDAFINKINKMHQKYPYAEVVFGGDYIDGRKDSKQVLNYVRYMQDKYNAKVLIGNHEDMLLDFIRCYDLNWIRNGGKTTVKSLFGRGYSKLILKRKLIDYKLYDGTSLIDWLMSLKHQYYNNDAVFVHAYLDLSYNSIKDSIKNTKYCDKIWRRDLSDCPDRNNNHLNKAVVFGHTPTCYFNYYGLNSNDKLEILKSKINDYQGQYSCPIYYYKKHNFSPIIACDGGCHGQLENNTGNVLVINKNKVIDWIN